MLDYTVKEVAVKDIRDFIEEHHYSHNINGLTISRCFGLYSCGKLVGAAIYGKPAMRGIEKRYQALGYDRVIEFRRLVLLDEMPKNSESWFISRTLRLLKRDFDLVVTYADEQYGHTGTIYKGSDFFYWGKTAKGVNYLFNGRLYHDKCARTKYKGEYKPFAKKLRAAIEDGTAEKIITKGKFTYLYSLKDREYRSDRQKENVEDL